MSDELDICDKCGKPIQPGAARYTGGESAGKYRHAECHDWRSPKDIMKELDALKSKINRQLGDLRRNLR